jgi:hypothetical protein
MKFSVLLTITSLLSILLFVFHLADDIVHGIEPGGLNNLFGGTAICIVWLYGTLVLADRRVGFVIMLLGGVFGLLVPYSHMRGAGVGEIAKSGGGFFFVGTLLVLALTGLFSAILAARALWNPEWGRSRLFGANSTREKT